MVKVVVKRETILNSENNRVVIEILVSLEKLKFNLDLYTKRPKGRSPLFPHENHISLTMAIGSLYEALLKFDAIKGKVRRTVEESKSSDALDAFTFLSSKEITAFKEKTLNVIRNKGAFHIDKEVVEEYIHSNNDEEQFTIWEEFGQGIEYSPIANEILSWWTLDNFIVSDIVNNTFFFAEAYNNLRWITNFLIVKWLGGKVVE